MAQTFDIRFAKSAGLAGLFEAPANEYRWKGAGRLSIDPTGISIAVRRGLLTLFARATTRRIPTHNLIEVYREGNALRLEFSTQESARTVLPIWVGDRDAAAQIVTLVADSALGGNRGWRSRIHSQVSIRSQARRALVDRRRYTRARRADAAAIFLCGARHASLGDRRARYLCLRLRPHRALKPELQNHEKASRPADPTSGTR